MLLRLDVRPEEPPQEDKDWSALYSEAVAPGLGPLKRFSKDVLAHLTQLAENPFGK